MLFYKRLLPDYLQMLSLRKLKIVSLQMLKVGLRLPLCFMVNSSTALKPKGWPAQQFLNGVLSVSLPLRFLLT